MNEQGASGFPLHLVLPLLSAFVYVVAALLLKRASELGADTWRAVRLCNFISATLFMPLLFMGGRIPSWGQFWQPALAAGFFVLGQVLVLLSLRLGDVSVATPVMGLKVVLVAFFTTVVLGDALTGRLWAAACLSTMAIVLLHLNRGAQHRHTGITILVAGSAAAAYALFDVLVQKWSPSWGTGRFLPVMMGFVVAISIALGPLGDRSSGRFDRLKANPDDASAPPMPWLVGGAICFALQGLMLIFTVSFYGQAALANVLYSSRGLWSVVVVWLAGHWFGNTERTHGPRVLAWRLLGAALLTGAILIVVLEHHSISDSRPAFR